MSTSVDSSETPSGDLERYVFKPHERSGLPAVVCGGARIAEGLVEGSN